MNYLFRVWILGKNRVARIALKSRFIITYCIVVRKSETRPHVTRTENFMKFGCVVFEICERTDGQTLGHRNTSYPSTRWSNYEVKCSIVCCNLVFNNYWNNIFLRFYQTSDSLVLNRRIYVKLSCTPCLKKVPPLVCYNFDAPEWILIFFWQKCYR